MLLRSFLVHTLVLLANAASVTKKCKVVADPAITPFAAEAFSFKGEGVYHVFKSDCGIDVQMRECKAYLPFSSYMSAIGIKASGHEMIFKQDSCTFDGEKCNSGTSGKQSGITLINYNPQELGTEDMGEYGPGSNGWYLRFQNVTVNVTKTNGIVGQISPGPYMMNVVISAPDSCTSEASGLCAESAGSLLNASIQSTKDAEKGDDDHGAALSKASLQSSRVLSAVGTELLSPENKFAATYKPLSYYETMEGLRNLTCAFIQQFMPTCHLNETVDVFTFRDVTVAVNNLGGMGPDYGEKHLIEYTNIGKYHGKNLSLIVTNASAVGGKTYEPAHPSWNGVRPGGNMGTISMKTDSKAVFKFAIVDAETHEPVTLPQLIITILDLDQNPNDKKRESVTPYGFETYTLSNNTEVEVLINDDGLTSFRSTTAGDGKDNPSDPMDLTDLQKARSVEFTFQNIDSFELFTQMTLGFKSQKGGNFIFSGPSSIVPYCDVEAPPSQ